MMILAPIAAMLIQFAISRQREFKADAVGAEICGRPIVARERAAQAGGRCAANPDERLAGCGAARAGESACRRIGGGIARLFSTHPPTAERVARLEALAA